MQLVIVNIHFNVPCYCNYVLHVELVVLAIVNIYYMLNCKSIFKIAPSLFVKLPLVGIQLTITIYKHKLKFTIYKLQFTNNNLQLRSYNLKITINN